MEVFYSEDKNLPTHEQLNALRAKTGEPTQFNWRQILDVQAAAVVTAWSGEELVGIGTLRKLGDSECNFGDWCVEQAYRERGVGSAIANRLEKKARELGYKTICADSVSKEAKTRLKKMGYREIKQNGEKTDYHKHLIGLHECGICLK